jgi:hypothetical protein
MATTTPNFGWPVPTSTDLVKDGAVAIEGLGDAIDASLLDLKGGTTGQVLAKASGTDLDFSWVAQDDSNAIQNAIVDAKGDLIGATAADTPARLAVGTNGQVLTADSTAATGLKWATAASGSAANSTAFVANNENTSSSTYTNLTTAGPAVTVTTGTKALVIITTEMQNGAASITGYMSVDISGATTLAASDAKALKLFTASNSNLQQTLTQAIIYTGLTAGSNTFTAKYRAAGSTAYYQNRYISVVDMGS